MVVGLIWNPRGLNRPEKLPRVHELIRETCPDLISFSESKKSEFTDAQLQSVDCNNMYNWNWLPAVGTGGGILVGVKENSFEIITWEIFKYYVSVIIKDRQNHKVWRFISTYGSSYVEFKLEYINELYNVVHWDGPTLIGGVIFTSLERVRRRAREILIRDGPTFSMIGPIGLT
jgi:hypothetical protein